MRRDGDRAVARASVPHKTDISLYTREGTVIYFLDGIRLQRLQEDINLCTSRGDGNGIDQKTIGKTPIMI